MVLKLYYHPWKLSVGSNVRIDESLIWSSCDKNCIREDKSKFENREYDFEKLYTTYFEIFNRMEETRRTKRDSRNGENAQN